MPFYYNVSNLNSQVTTNTEGSIVADTTSTETTEPNSIWNGGVASAKESDAAASTTEDGVDDGQISGSQKAKAALKGAWSIVPTMLEHPIATVVVAGACLALTVATAGAAAPLLVAAGAAIGGAKVINGIKKADEATTDAEAEAAWEGIGSGVSDIGLSALGAGTALKMAGTTAEAAEAAKTAGTAAEAASKGVEVAGAAAKTAEAADGSAKASIISKTVGKAVEPFKNLGKCIKETPNSIKESYRTIKSGEGKQNLIDGYNSGKNYLTGKKESVEKKVTETKNKIKNKGKDESDTKIVDAKDPVESEEDYLPDYIPGEKAKLANAEKLKIEKARVDEEEYTPSHPYTVEKQATKSSVKSEEDYLPDYIPGEKSKLANAEKLKAEKAKVDEEEYTPSHPYTVEKQATKSSVKTEEDYLPDYIPGEKSKLANAEKLKAEKAKVDEEEYTPSHPYTVEKQATKAKSTEVKDDNLPEYIPGEKAKLANAEKLKAQKAKVEDDDLDLTPSRPYSVSKQTTKPSVNFKEDDEFFTTSRPFIPIKA